MKKYIILLIVIFCLTTTISFSMEIYNTLGFTDWHNGIQLTNDTGWNESVTFLEYGNSTAGIIYLAKLNYIYKIKPFETVYTALNDSNIWKSGTFNSTVNFRLVIGGNIVLNASPLIFWGYIGADDNTEYAGFGSTTITSEITVAMKNNYVKLVMTKGGKRWDNHYWLANITLW